MSQPPAIHTRLHIRLTLQSSRRNILQFHYQEKRDPSQLICHNQFRLCKHFSTPFLITFNSTTTPKFQFYNIFYRIDNSSILLCHYKYRDKEIILPVKIIQREPGTELGSRRGSKPPVLKCHLPSPTLEGWLQSCSSRAGRGDTGGVAGAGCAGIQLLG